MPLALTSLLRRLAAVAAAVVFSTSLAQAEDAGTAGKPALPARVAFVGDSMVDGIWGGFVRLTGNDPCLKDVLAFGRYGENSSGLSRADRDDWPAKMAKIITEFKPDLVVVSLGLNDRQGLVDEHRHRTAYNAPDYNEQYGIQVKALLGATLADKAEVMWIGLPVLRDADADADAKNKNKIFQSVIAAYNNPRVEYVAPWQLNPGADEVYAANGPGVSGTLVSLRASDGIHFTGAGYDSIAAYLLPKVLGRLRQEGFVIADSCSNG